MSSTGADVELLRIRREKNKHGLDDAGLPDLNGFDDFMPGRIDNDDGAVVFRIDVGALAVWREGDIARAMADLEGGDDFPGCGIEHGDLAVLFRGDVDLFSVGSDFDTFRLTAHLEGFDDGTGGDVDDAYTGDVLVGDVELLSIGADIEVFGIGASGDRFDNFSLRDIEDADSVGAFVGRGKRALVDVRSSNGSSAESDVNRLLIGAGMDSARTFAERNRSEDVVVSAVDDGEVAGDFVGDVDLWSSRLCWRRGGGRSGGGSVLRLATNQQRECAGKEESSIESRRHPLFSFVGEVDGSVLLRSDGDLLFLRSQLLLPYGEGVGSGREVADSEGTIVFRDGEIGMVEDADVGVHPAMDIALYRDHDFGLDELAIERSIAWALAVVPFAIDLGHRVNVVRDRVGVDDLERLVHLNSEDAWVKPAAALIDDNGFRGRGEVLSFEAALDIDESICERAV